MNTQDKKLIKGVLFFGFGYVLVLLGKIWLKIGNSIKDQLGIGILMLGGIFMFIGLLKSQGLKVKEN